MVYLYFIGFVGYAGVHAQPLSASMPALVASSWRQTPHHPLLPRQPPGLQPWVSNHSYKTIMLWRLTLCVLVYSIQFWKWAVTGARDNSEIKLWACESWTCLQTINFEPSPSTMPPSLSATGPPRTILKAALDLSSQYLVLSDIYNRVSLQLTRKYCNKILCVTFFHEHVKVSCVSYLSLEVKFVTTK